MAAARLALKEGQILRCLGVQESIWLTIFTKRAGTGLLQYSVIVDSEKKLEPQKVQMALEALQRQIPMLRTRVERRDGHNCLVAGRCPSVQLSVLPPGGDWLAEHNRQLREQTIDTAAGPLWKAGLLNSPTNFPPPAATSSRAVVYLSLCHTITDGASNRLIVGQLLQNLDRAVRGCALDDEPPAPVYPSMEELLRGSRVGFSLPLARLLLRGAASILRPPRAPLADAFVAPFDPRRPPADYANVLLPAALSAAETARLRAQCRRRGVTLTAAVSAAVGAAGARLLDAPPAEFRCSWLVDARRYAPQAERMCLSMVSGLVGRVRANAPFWPLAAEVGAELRQGLELRLPLLLVKASSRLLTPRRVERALGKPSRWPAGRSRLDFSVNNVGALDAVFAPTSAVRAVELHRTFRAHPALEGLFGSHCFHTVGGRLYYDLNFVRGRVRRQDAERFSQLVLERLRRAAGSADGDD